MHEGPARPGRRAVAGALTLALLLVSCARAEPLPAATAVAHYDAVVSELTTALADRGLSWRLAPATRHVEDADNGCSYTPGTWMPDARPREPLALDDAAWDPWIDAMNPVLAEHGFAEVKKPQLQEATRSLSSKDQHGARLEVSMSGSIRIWGAAVAADPCAKATLGL